MARADFAGKPLLVAFVCSHCPFVVHIRARLAIIAIKSNDDALG